MALSNWLFHEKKEYEFLDNILRRESVEFEIIKQYSKTIHDKLVAVMNKDLQNLKELMRLEEKEEGSLESELKKTISDSIVIFSRRKLEIRGFLPAQRKIVISTNNDLKKLKKIIREQIIIISKKSLTESDWKNLQNSTANEARILLNLKEQDVRSLYKMTIQVKQKLIPRKVNYLSIKEVIKIHDLVVEKWGGLQGVRDMRLLDSAVNRPMQGGMSGDFYITIYDKAAALMHSLVKNHPFNDGNKRTAAYATYQFLRQNGKKSDLFALERIVKSIATSRKPKVEEIRTELMRLAA